jgi:hypothetical protein
MAGFKTHITVSTLLGAGYGTAAYMLYDIPAPSCILAGGLCGVSGMLPDLDSGPGVPLRESVAFAAAVVPMLLLHRLQLLGLSYESIILAGAGVYLLIRFGLGRLLDHFTIHRGMFHSIPAVLIAGELFFLLATNNEVHVRLFKAGAVMLGYLSHLVLDEIYSFQLSGRGVRLKSSFGTALKLFGRAWWPNLSAFAKLGLLTFLVFQDPNWINSLYDRRLEPPVAQGEKKDAPQDAKKSGEPTVPHTAETLIDQLLR